MARDYKVRNSRSRNAENGGWRWLLALILIILFIALIIFLKQQSIKLAASEENNPIITTTPTEQSSKKLPHPSNNPARPTSAPSTPQPRFDFYTMLPQGQTVNPQPTVTPQLSAPLPPPTVTHSTTPEVLTTQPIIEKPQPPVEKTKTAPPAANKDSVEEETRELLQSELGEIKTAVTKSTQKSSIYLVQLGTFKTFAAADSLKAQITLQGYEVKLKAIKKNNLTLYRVFLGPYSSLTEAKQQEQLLLKNKIKSRIVKG